MGTRKILIMDGGVGTEISRRGIPLHPCFWSAMAHMTHPEIVYQIHSDFIEAGADIISSNTFMAGRHILEAGGVHEFEKVNRQAVEIACNARKNSDRSGLLVAGTLSTSARLDDAQKIPRGSTVVQNFRDQADILADSGVDILMCELLFDSESAMSILDACCQTGLPVWAGLSATKVPGDERLMAFRQPGKFKEIPHELFKDLVENVVTLPVNMIGVMHTDVSLMDEALRQLSDCWKGSMLAYAKTGLASDHDWAFDSIIGVEDYCNLVSHWVERFDLDMIGGCCGITPSHIDRLSDEFHSI